MPPMREATFNRRPIILFVVGVLWLSMGLSVLIDPTELQNARDIPPFFFPTWLRVTGWSVTGFVATIFAFRRTNSWLVTHDYVGWIALMLMPLQRVIAYGIGVVEEFSSKGYTSVYNDVWRDFTGWFTILFLLSVAVGWPEKRREIDTQMPIPYGEGEGEGRDDS